MNIEVDRDWLDEPDLDCFEIVAMFDMVDELENQMMLGEVCHMWIVLAKHWECKDDLVDLNLAMRFVTIQFQHVDVQFHEANSKSAHFLLAVLCFSL